MFGSTVLRLGGTSANATLVLRDNRVFTGAIGAIVEALVGVRLEPDRLLAVLAGCISTSSEATAGTRQAAVAEVSTSDAVVFLAEDASGWRPRAGVFDQMLVDYRRSQDGYPRDIRITSEPGRSTAVDLRIEVRDPEINPVFTGAEFRVAPPRDAVPASLDDLRAEGPLGK